MLVPEVEPIACPKCGAKIRVTIQATVRAADSKKGTTVDCQRCHGKWVYYRGPPARFGPLSRPKRKPRKAQKR
jgi:hypothetical protein